MRSEEEIIDLIVNRDESVMSELMDKYQRPLMRLAMNMLDSEEDARECVNDTFYEVWKSVPQTQKSYLVRLIVRSRTPFLFCIPIGRMVPLPHPPLKRTAPLSLSIFKMVLLTILCQI